MALKNNEIKIEVPTPDSPELQSKPHVEFYFSKSCTGVVSTHALVNDENQLKLSFDDLGNYAENIGSVRVAKGYVLKFADGA